MQDQPPFDGPPFDPPGGAPPPHGQSARVMLVALAAVAPKSGAVAPAAATETCRRILGEWQTAVEAPDIELRRAGRRLAAVFGRLSVTGVETALAFPDAGSASRALVDECARLDRDFAWDVPLRDISRAIMEAAVAGVRESDAADAR